MMKQALLADTRGEIVRLALEVLEVMAYDALGREVVEAIAALTEAKALKRKAHEIICISCKVPMPRDKIDKKNHICLNRKECAARTRGVLSINRASRRSHICGSIPAQDTGRSQLAHPNRSSYFFMNVSTHACGKHKVSEFAQTS